MFQYVSLLSLQALTVYHKSVSAYDIPNVFIHTTTTKSRRTSKCAGVSFKRGRVTGPASKKKKNEKQLGHHSSDQLIISGI